MKKQLTLMALTLASVFAFAACGTPAEKPVGTPADKSTETPADKPEEAPAEGGGKTIVYWSMWDSTEAQGQVIEKAVRAYEAASGNKVDLQFKGRTGIREGLQPALDAGTEIDLFDEDIDRVNVTWGAYLMDLEELAKANNYEATANAGLMAACREVGGGKLKSIPYQPNVFAVFYNQEIFDKAGIQGTPKTWDEFLAVCQKVKDAGFIPMTCDDAYMTALAGYQLGRVIGEEAVVDVVTNGNWAENPGVLTAAMAMEDMAKKGYFSPKLASNVWPAGQNGEFALGEVAMYLNGSWLPNEVRPITGDDFKWGCFSYPAVPNGVAGIDTSNFGAQVLAINKNSKVAPEAFEIIKYITKGEFDKMLSDESVGIPADSTNSQWPVMLEGVKPVMESLKTRWTWAAGVETNVDMTPAIKENFAKLCGGSLTAQQFVDAMEAASK